MQGNWGTPTKFSRSLCFWGYGKGKRVIRYGGGWRNGLYSQEILATTLAKKLLPVGERSETLMTFREILIGERFRDPEISFSNERIPEYNWGRKLYLLYNWLLLNPLLRPICGTSDSRKRRSHFAPKRYVRSQVNQPSGQAFLVAFEHL